MIDTANLNNLIGADVHGPDDKKIGTVGQVFVDSDDRTPTWITVQTGLFGPSESFAPISDATFDGHQLRIGYDKNFVKDAPRISTDGALSREEEDTLYSYYGRDTQPSARLDSGDSDLTADARRGADGYDTSGPTTDDAMTRSEERLRVGTETVETGRARLRKYIVTEQVTQTVPVSHEEVTLSREPITDANIGDATAGPDLSEEEHEVVLTGERVITDKETVPVERVRLGKETVTQQQNVSADVAHEEVELVDPDVDADRA